MTPKPLVTLLTAALLSAPLLSHSSALAQAPAPPATSNAAPPPPPADAPGAPSSRGYQRQGPPQISRGDFRSGNSGSGMGMHPGSRIVPPGEWWKNPDTIQKLSLTEDQQKKMDGIFQQSRLTLIDLKANLEKQEVLLEPMLNANPPDSAKALAQISKVADARAELEKTNAKMLLGIRSVLTADQWTKLQTSERSRPWHALQRQARRKSRRRPIRTPRRRPRPPRPHTQHPLTTNPGAPLFVIPQRSGGIRFCFFSDRSQTLLWHLYGPHKSPMLTPQSHTPKLFFTLLLSKIACQAPKPTKNPVTHSI